MELNNIKSSGTTWGSEASALNENFGKIGSSIEQLKNSTTRNKGYFSTAEALKSSVPTAGNGDKAYVGSAYPYQIWTWNGSAWANSGSMGGEESVNLGDYHTAEYVDRKLSELGSEVNNVKRNFVSELGGKEELQPTWIYEESDEHHYINPDGSLSTVVNGAFNISKPIHVSKYSTIIVHTQGSLFCPIAQTDEKGTYYKPLVVAPSNNEGNKEYSYTVKEDCYVVVCARTGSGDVVIEYESHGKVKHEVEQVEAMMKDEIERVEAMVNGGEIPLKAELLLYDNATGSTEYSPVRAFVCLENKNYDYIRTNNGLGYIIYGNNEGLGFPSTQLTPSTWSYGDYSLKDFPYKYIIVAMGGIGDIFENQLENAASIIYHSVEKDIEAIKKKNAKYSEDFNSLGLFYIDANVDNKGGYWDGISLNVKEGTGLYSLPIDLDSSANYVEVSLSVINKASNGRYIMVVSDGKIVSKVNENGTEVLNAEYYERDGKPIYKLLCVGDSKLYISFSELNSIERCVWIKSSQVNVVYIAENGDDNNFGTDDSPLQTVDKALELGADTILLKSGIYRQTIDLTKAKSSSVTISATENKGRVIFEGQSSNTILCTSASYVEGKTKVRYCQTSLNPLGWIFQKNIADDSTLIKSDERHPLQRGLKHRCEDTKIVRCDSETLQDALDEIESSSIYKYYKDGNSLYFSSPMEVSEDKPVVCSVNGVVLFRKNNKNLSLVLNRIETNGLSINLTEMISPKLYDCKVRNVNASGGFVYDYTSNAVFVRCEASRVYQESGYGDGFNAHNVSDSRNPLSKGCTAMFVDCWSHDNMDDGFSDHENAESTLIGGLYEFNGKGGVTPSFGSHCTCYNVYSRKNHNGFYYIGASGDGDEGGQLSCFGCIAENNTMSPIDSEPSQGKYNCGFKTFGAGNVMVLVDCKSIGNGCGYSVESGCKAILTDCKSKDDAVTKNGVGTFVIKNTSIVE